MEEAEQNINFKAVNYREILNTFTSDT